MEEEKMEFIIPEENESYDDYINRIKNIRVNYRNKNTYMELHHILPKCLDGSDDIGNLIYLYPEEHYFAHALLCFKYPDEYKLLYA